MVIKNSKKRFLRYELGLLSIKGALSTRNSDAPVYAKEVKVYQRTREKKTFREFLDSLEYLYLKGGVTDEQHIEFIQKTADDLSIALRDKLHNGRFRIGVAQKLINLHLKYLWVAGFIEQPPHCPIDGIVRDKAMISYDWTTSDSIEAYAQAVEELREVASLRTLSLWELEEFRRRDEQ